MRDIFMKLCIESNWIVVVCYREKLLEVASNNDKKNEKIYFYACVYFYVYMKQVDKK